MTPAQARAARAFLNLDMKTVCEQAPIGKRTLTEFERGSRAIADTTLVRLKGYYIAQGIGFKSTISGDEVAHHVNSNNDKYDIGNVRSKLEYYDRFKLNELEIKVGTIRFHINEFGSLINFSSDIIQLALDVSELNQKQFALELDCSPAFVSAVLLQKKSLSFELASKIQNKYPLKKISDMVLSEKKLRKLLTNMRRISEDLLGEVQKMQQANSVDEKINL